MECKWKSNNKCGLCSLLAEEAIHAALWDYSQKEHVEIEGLEPPVSDISEKEEEEEY